MSREVVEIVYVRHRVYHVIAQTGLFSTSYCVKSTDGHVFASFNRLDAALRYARDKAAQC